jgi:hypothetical protein
LAPGPGRFYYLPRSGYILSAQRLLELSTASQVTEINRVLARVIGYSQRDLARNRAGCLGLGQALRMLSAIAGWTLLWSVGGVLIIILGVQVVSVVFGDGREMVLEALQYVAFGALAIVFGVVFLWQLGLDVLTGQVLTIEGPLIQSRSDPKTSWPIYFCRVGGRQFMVSRAAYAAAVSGFVYRAYYTRRTERLLALEAVSS